MKTQINPQIVRMISPQYQSIINFLNAEKVNERYRKYLPQPIDEILTNLPNIKGRFLGDPHTDLILYHHKMNIETLTKWGAAFNRLLTQQGDTHKTQTQWIELFSYWLDFEDLTSNPDNRS